MNDSPAGPDPKLDPKNNPRPLATITNNQIVNAADTKAWKKILRAESDTDGADLERKRMQLAEKAAILGGITNFCLSELPKDATQEQKDEHFRETQRLMASATLLGMQGMIEGLGLIVDCVTTREKVPLDNGKVGFYRFSIGSHAQEINEALWGEPPILDSKDPEEQEGEAGIFDMLETGLEMLEEIGIKQQAFKGKHGQHDPQKYSRRTLEPASKQDKKYSAQEAVAQEEIDKAVNMSAQEAIQKLKKTGQ